MATTLRQVVLTIRELQPDLERFRELFRAGTGTVDAGMVEFGLTHEVIRVGRDTYLEVCAPLDPAADTTATRFLQRGGPGGYMAVIEVPSAEVLRTRLTELGLAIPLAQHYHGNELTQLHPREFGTLLEADAIGGPEDWHYPDLESTETVETTTGIVAVDVAVADPAAMADRWAAAFDERVRDDGASINFSGGGIVRFVAEAPGHRGVVAFDVAATERGRAGEEHQLGGVVVRFV